MLKALQRSQNFALDQMQRAGYQQPQVKTCPGTGPACISARCGAL